jgi:hypothetical protein
MFSRGIFGGPLLGLLWTLASVSPALAAESLTIRLSGEEHSEKIKKRALTAIIGDPIYDDFSPRFKLSGWGGECHLIVALSSNPSASFGEPSPITAEGRYGLSVREGDHIEHKLYRRADDAFEWEITLDRAPEGNILSFAYESKGLCFLYQPELTEEEIKAGAERPDSAIGSYAVYISDGIGNRIHCRGMDTVFYDYETGKVFHIYRPKAIDIRGRAVWCDLTIDSTIRIAIPEYFLKNAAYPISVDPTFGNTNVGASTAYMATVYAQALFGASAYRHAASAGEVITSYSVYCLTYSSPAYIALAAYNLSGGFPDSRLAPAVQLTVTNGSMQWNTTATVSHSMTAGETYVVAYGEISPSAAIRGRYDVESVVVSNNGASGLTAEWTHISTGGNRWSMYATYSTSTAISAPIRRRAAADELNR